MGALIVRHYPTKLFLKAADHTYVECGTGAKGWSCWGGKQNGKYLRAAPGSTRRANEIAEPKERAGIMCYLINGVCHQAANRILLPADITVDGARGYSLSVSIFGVYGRPRGFLGTCKAPFNQHAGVSGDLTDCQGDVTADVGQAISFNTDRLDFTDLGYMSEVQRLYDQTSEEALSSINRLVEFQMAQFGLLVNHKFGGPGFTIAKNDYASLMSVREEFEQQRLGAEEEFAATRDAMMFVDKFDALTLKFQADVARVLDQQSYQTLLNLTPDDRIVLSDPESIEQAYGSRPDPAGAAS